MVQGTMGQLEKQNLHKGTKAWHIINKYNGLGSEFRNTYESKSNSSCLSSAFSFLYRFVSC